MKEKTFGELKSKDIVFAYKTAYNEEALRGQTRRILRITCKKTRFPRKGFFRVGYRNKYIFSPKIYLGEPVNACLSELEDYSALIIATRVDKKESFRFFQITTSEACLKACADSIGITLK